MKLAIRNGKRVLLITRKEWEEMGRLLHWDDPIPPKSDHLERFTIIKDPQY